MRARDRILAASLVVLVSAVGLAGCDAGSEQSGESTAGAPGADPMAPTDVDMDDAADREEGDAGDSLDGGGDGSTTADEDRQVVLRADLGLVVDDTEATAQEIASIADREGGFVAGSDLERSTEGGQLRGWLQIRIPADGLEAVVDEIASLASEVRSRSVGSEDVTSQVVDLDARLENLRAYEDELRALLAEVRERPGSTPDDLLVVFDRIASTRGEIERLQAQADSLADRVQLATVVVTLTPSEDAEPLVDSWSPGDVARRAVRWLVDVGQGLTTAGIWFVVAVLPVVLVVVLVGFGLRQLVRRRRVRRSA